MLLRLPGRSFSQSVHFVAVKHCVDIGLGVGEEHALASEAESVGLVESFEDLWCPVSPMVAIHESLW